MNTVGISLVDSGITACLYDGDDTALIPLEEKAVSTPGYACLGDRGLLLGEAAVRMWKLVPHRSTNTFWNQLSLQTPAMPTGRKPISRAHLAYLHIKRLWQRIQAIQEDISAVGLALPGYFLDGDPADEQRLGIILGIISDLNIPISVLLPLETAGLHFESSPEIIDAHHIYHLDIHQHQTVLSLLSGEREVRGSPIGKLPDCGSHNILENLHTKLAQRFLGDTAFDISEDFEVEQEFFMRVREILLQTPRATGEISVAFGGQHRAIQVAEDHVEQILQPQLERIGTMVGRALEKNPHASAGEPVTIQLSGRAATMPGLLACLARMAPSPIHLISAEKGRASAGAAMIASRFQPARDLQHTPVFASWARPRQPKGLDQAESEAQSLPPTHLLFKSVAYPIESSAIIRDHHANGVKLPRSISEVFQFPWAVENARFSLDPSVVIQLNNQRPGGLFSLKTGDHLSASSRGRRISLECIYCPATSAPGTEAKAT